MRSSSWRWISGSALVVVCACTAVFIASGGPDRLDTGDKVASLASLLVGIASLVVAVGSLQVALRQGRDDPAGHLAKAEEELARTVARQWQREAAIRGLLHPEPLRVRWSSTRRPVEASAAEVLGAFPGARPTRLNFRGEVRTLADTWERLPARQVVVLGPPGAGKTSLVVLLVRQLLTRRVAGEPVPVLLSLAGWDPGRVELDSWLVQRLVADYPRLAVTRLFGRDTAARLVNQGHVVPVLDGLDEMPDELRTRALSALNSAVSDARPFVLTCRTAEYEEIVAETGTPLARAAVVELAPVAAPDIALYLTAAQVDGEVRWATVLEALQSEPDGVLARALSRPLMTFLARTAYTPPTTDPGELLACATVDEVEELLLSAYLPMVYRPQVPALPYTAKQAQYWLTNIAFGMTAKGTHNLKPWLLDIPMRLDRRRTATRLGMFLAALAVFFGSLNQIGRSTPLGYATTTMISVVVLMLLILTFVVALTPRRRIRPFRFRVRFRRVVLGACAGPLACLLLPLPFILFDLEPDSEVPPGVPAQWAATTFLLLLSSVGGALAAGLTGPVSETDAPDPVVALRRDGAAFLTVAIGLPTIGVLLFSIVEDISMWSFIFGSSFGFLLGLLPAYLFGFGKAWFSWQYGRLAFFICGLTPWRLLDFIEDAHRRGVLRVVGLEYQFRHAKLQDYLARSHARNS